MKYLKGDCNIGLVLPQKVGGGGFSRKMEQESCDERVIVWVQREFGGGRVLLFLWDVDVGARSEVAEGHH